MTSEFRLPTHERISVVTQPTPEQDAVLQKATLKDGSIPNALRTMAHSVELLKRMNSVGGYFLRFASLPERTLKLVILRVAHRSNSLYEFAQHRQMSLNQKLLTAQEIDGIVADSYPWSAEDRLYLAAVDELFAHSCIGEETWAGLAKTLTTQEMIELTVLAGFYQTLAGFLNSAGVQLDPSVKQRDWPSIRKT
jgi:4-carboxymuconolactone decarboxylase